MRYDNKFSTMNGLPDAPMAMPKQIIEQRTSWVSTLRSVFLSALVRS